MPAKQIRPKTTKIENSTQRVAELRTGPIPGLPYAQAADSIQNIARKVLIQVSNDTEQIQKDTDALGASFHTPNASATTVRQQLQQLAGDIDAIGTRVLAVLDDLKALDGIDETIRTTAKKQGTAFLSSVSSMVAAWPVPDPLPPPPSPGPPSPPVPPVNLGHGDERRSGEAAGASRPRRRSQSRQ